MLYVMKLFGISECLSVNSSVSVRFLKSLLVFSLCWLALHAYPNCSLSFSKLSCKIKMAETKMNGEDLHGLSCHCQWH